jgi:hypothetical protein
MLEMVEGKTEKTENKKQINIIGKKYRSLPGFAVISNDGVNMTIEFECA